MLRVFRRLELQERFFQLSEEFGQIGQFFLRHDSASADDYTGTRARCREISPQ